jgi:hypothetical protein
MCEICREVVPFLVLVSVVEYPVERLYVRVLHSVVSPIYLTEVQPGQESLITPRSLPVQYLLFSHELDLFHAGKDDPVDGFKPVNCVLLHNTRECIDHGL